FRRGAQASRGLRIVTGPVGHVAGKLRQSVGAAGYHAAAMAAGQHGPRPEQLEHDPEKWVPVFPATNAKRLRGDHAQNKEMERDDDSKKSHHAPGMIAIMPG